MCPKCRWECPQGRKQCLLCGGPLGRVVSPVRPAAETLKRPTTRCVEVFRTRDPLRLQVAQASLRCARIRFSTLGETASAYAGNVVLFDPGARLEVARRDRMRAARAIERTLRVFRRRAAS